MTAHFSGAILSSFIFCATAVRGTPTLNILKYLPKASSANNADRAGSLRQADGNGFDGGGGGATTTGAGAATMGTGDRVRTLSVSEYAAFDADGWPGTRLQSSAVTSKPHLDDTGPKYRRPSTSPSCVP
jgi:hypothetical protein